MRISDWSSDVCSSDLVRVLPELLEVASRAQREQVLQQSGQVDHHARQQRQSVEQADQVHQPGPDDRQAERVVQFVEQLGQSGLRWLRAARSEEHTSELQSLMRSSYAVFCLKKKSKRCQRGISEVNEWT